MHSVLHIVLGPEVSACPGLLSLTGNSGTCSTYERKDYVIYLSTSYTSYLGPVYDVSCAYVKCTVPIGVCVIRETIGVNGQIQSHPPVYLRSSVNRAECMFVGLQVTACP